LTHKSTLFRRLPGWRTSGDRQAEKPHLRSSVPVATLPPVRRSDGQCFRVAIFLKGVTKKYQKESDSQFSRISASENICGTDVVQIPKLKRGYVIASHNLLILLG